MILRELNLIGFGKFENKNIELDKGLNIIYGENEAGKSTLHSFIDGMFYGFLRANVKSALYSEEYDKYNPWNKNRYAGIIRFQFQGKDYRIERDFTRGSEETKIFEEITGREISRSIETGKTRILQPGIHFFGFNTRVFSNTISIKQLQSITDKKLANDVREKLINVNTSLDDNISVDKAVSDIDNLLSEIGSERAHTRPYAINLKAIEKLEKEKENIEKEKKEYEIYLEEKSNLEKDKVEEKEALSILTRQLKNVEILEKKSILEEAEKISREIEDFKIEKEKLKDFSTTSKKDYEYAIKINENIEHQNKNIKDMKLNLETMSSRIEVFNPEHIGSQNEERLNDLIKDYNYYEELENEKKEIQYSKDSSYIRVLQRDKEINDDKKKKHKRNSIILLVINLLIIVVLYLNEISIIFLSVPMLIIGIVAIYYIMGHKNISIEENKIKAELEQARSQEMLNNDRIEKISQIQEDLLSKNNVNTKLELQSLIDRLRIEIFNKLDKEKQYNELKKERSVLNEKLKEQKNTVGKNIKEFNEILLKNNCKDLNDLSLALDKKALYEESLRGISTKEEFLEKVLGNYTVDELKEKINKTDIGPDYEIEADKEKITDEIEEKKKKISQINLDLATKEERIKILDSKISRLVEVEEEIYIKKEYKKELDNKILALNLAKFTIEQLSEEIHTEFAPNINKKLSKIVEKITSEKYNNIKITEDLNISLENPNTDEIIKIEGLSGGTIDQLYFALRFGIMDEITENNLPLLLDDCFIQYDKNRLKNVLEFLINNKGERQVLLFTCHEREKNILENLGFDFNLINLT